MRGRILTCVALCGIALVVAACPQQIRQAKQAVQTAQQIQQGLPRPSSAKKSWHVIASGKPHDEATGIQHTLAVIGGSPAVAYTDKQHVYFAQATQQLPAQTADWRLQDLEPQHGCFGPAGLAQLDGKPVLLYRQLKPRQFVLAVATSPQPRGHADWQKFVLPEDRYYPAQLAEVDGRLAIATLRKPTAAERAAKSDAASREIVFLRQPDPGVLDPVQWRVSTFALDEPCLAGTVQLIDDAGVPALAFSAGASSNRTLYLWRAKCADPASAADWEEAVIAGGAGYEPTNISLGVHDGALVLAYELGSPPRVEITFARPGADGAGFNLTSFTLADLDTSGWQTALASHDGKLCIGWSFWAQVFVFESETPAPTSKDDFRSYFMSESPGSETVSDCELAVCGGKLVGTYIHEGTPGELRFVVFE